MNLHEATQTLRRRIKAAGIEIEADLRTNVAVDQKPLMFVGCPFTAQEAADGSWKVYCQAMQAIDEGLPAQAVWRAALEQALLVGAIAASSPES